MFFRRVIPFEGVRIYELSWMRRGAGLCLPGLGIIIAPGLPDNQRNALLRHEFGHILQAKKVGLIAFYFRIGLPSLFSAMRDGRRGHRHHMFWTETDADRLSVEYFKKG